jgi:hypothetical protein
MAEGAILLKEPIAGCGKAGALRAAWGELRRGFGCTEEVEEGGQFAAFEIGKAGHAPFADVNQIGNFVVGHAVVNAEQRGEAGKDTFPLPAMADGTMLRIRRRACVLRRRCCGLLRIVLAGGFDWTQRMLKYEKTDDERRR